MMKRLTSVAGATGWMIILTASVLTSCYRHRTNDALVTPHAMPQVFDGHYVAGFEHSIFYPCSSSSAGTQWWVILGARALAQWDSIKPHLMTPRAFVRWKATVSDTGRVGHLGQSGRYVVVDSIIAAHDETRLDCAAPRF